MNRIRQTSRRSTYSQRYCAAIAPACSASAVGNAEKAQRKCSLRNLSVLSVSAVKSILLTLNESYPPNFAQIHVLAAVLRRHSPGLLRLGGWERRESAEETFSA